MDRALRPTHDWQEATVNSLQQFESAHQLSKAALQQNPEKDEDDLSKLKVMVLCADEPGFGQHHVENIGYVDITWLEPKSVEEAIELLQSHAGEDFDRVIMPGHGALGGPIFVRHKPNPAVVVSEAGAAVEVLFYYSRRQPNSYFTHRFTIFPHECFEGSAWDAVNYLLKDEGFPALAQYNYGSIQSEGNGQSRNLSGDQFEKVVCDEALTHEILSDVYVEKMSRTDRENSWKPDNDLFMESLGDVLSDDGWIYNGNCRSGLDYVRKAQGIDRISYAQRLANITGHTVYGTHIKTSAPSTLHNIAQIEAADNKCDPSTWEKRLFKGKYRVREVDRIQCYQPTATNEQAEEQDEARADN